MPEVSTGVTHCSQHHSFPSVTTNKSLKDCLRHFTPAWFAVIMGTGAISILFHNYPYPTRTLYIFTFIIFFLNLVLFIIFNILTIARYVIFPDIWSIMIRHPVQSLYLGCYPMGGSTLINIGVSLIYQQYGFGGKPFLYFLWAMWWLEVGLSFLCVFPLVHIMKTRQDHTLSRMTAIWLLPIVTFVVASSTGGVIAPALLPFSRYHALITLTLSAYMVFVGLAFAFMILSIYFLRLITYGLPQGASVISVFIPLGPMGQGGYAILLLGQGFRSILPSDDGSVLSDQNTGEVLNVICIAAAFVLWSIATAWLLYALLAVAEVANPQGEAQRFPFKLPVWGLIFPNGVYANLTLRLALELDITCLRIWGAIWAPITLLVWSLVFTRTLTLLRYGRIFESPCIEEVDMTRKNQKDLLEEMTYSHQERQATRRGEHNIETTQMNEEPIWRSGSSNTTIRPQDTL
ncbi:hypothetical protein BDW22DRAFT_1357999 [Trametopsis cervina]|nr:hypothetical protein BDW22DRAFT_1357999 [Trametopsis cervina]